MSERAGDRALPPVLRQQHDVSLGFMLRLLALIAGCLAVMLIVAWAMFPREAKDQRFALPLPSFPGPRLQPSPRADMSAFYAEEMTRLNGVGWVDKPAGVAHIPIAQAMQDVAKAGIPGWPTSPAASEGDRR